MSTHTVIFGEAGQVARHVTPEHVSGATFEITDMSQALDAAERVLASGAATAPSWSLVLDDTAGPGEPDSTLIPVTATVGPVLGEAAILVAADGTSEPFTIAGISAGDILRTSSLLGATFAAASTVESTTITADIPIAVFDFEDALLDGRSLRIVWTYALASGPRVITESIVLARASEAAMTTGAAIETLLGGYPPLKGQILEGLTIEALAAYSFKRIVAEFERRLIPHTDLMLGTSGEMLLVAKMLAEASIRGYAPGQTSLTKFQDDTRDDYGTQREALVVGTPGRASHVPPSGVVQENPDQTYRGPVFGA
jgi:hypothetical protein